MQTGHAAQVVSLAFSHDGRLLASGSVDNTVLLWDPLSGNQLRALKGHDMTVMSVAFSPDDRLLASGSSDNTIKIWDVAANREKQTLKGHKLYVKSISFSPDGKLLASGSADGKVKLWDIINGRELRTMLPNSDPNNSMGIRVTFSPDGRYLATSGEIVKLWEVGSGKEVLSIRAHQGTSIPDIPIAFSRDSKVLSTGGKNIQFWDSATGKLLKMIPASASALAFSPDSQTIASSEVTEVKLWNIRSGEELRGWEGPPLGVEVLTFSPDGKTLATGNGDNTVTIWDPANGEKLRLLKGYAEAVTTATLNGNGRILAHGITGTIGRTDTIRIWDPTTGEMLRSLIGQRHAAHSLGLSEDGTKLISSGAGNAAIGLWNVGSAGQLKKFQSSGSGFIPSDVAISSDGRLIAAGGRDGNVKIWEAESGRELFTWPGHKKSVRSIAFSPGGDMLATGSQDADIKLWSVVHGKEISTLVGHEGGVVGIAFSPDGKKLASGSQDRTVLLWDVASQSLEEGFTGHSAWVNTVAFSRNGEKLASGGEDGSIRVWDLGTHRLLHTLAGHTGSVSSVTFTPDSKLLISGSQDASMKLWDAADGRELASLFSLGQQDWLVLTPDGLFDGSPPAWNRILWRFSQNIFDVAPVELFFNEYYYPGLLADLYSGKRPAAPKNISQRDRRQPVLKLAGTASTTVSSRNTIIKIDVSSAPAGAQDLRLFRNGSLVKVWRGDVLKGQRSALLQTEVPIVAGANRFTAYAFNRDNVKSADATLTLTGAESLKQPGTLYILAVAINKYANPQFDLRFAVADANDFATEVQNQEARLKSFSRTEVISLQDSRATKLNILVALKDLAVRAKPEDAVIVYYAGHGTAQQNQFYLIPHDLGYHGPRNKIDPLELKSVLTNSVSDRELERAFESIDAGRFLLVIDACNSGQALEAEEKRRGPMNSKGLAQLAYEKGIYILTAAQSYQAALEPSDLKHGLLTYALVEEGLKKQSADVEPRDGKVVVREWFSYVMKRVPQLQEQRMRQASQSGRQLVYVEGDEGTEATKRNVQRPRIFYRRELEERPFTIAVFGTPATAPPQ